MLLTRPAQAVEIDGGVLGIRALSTAHSQRSFRRTILVEPIDVDLAVDYVASIVPVLAVHVRAGRRFGSSTLVKVTSRHR